MSEKSYHYRIWLTKWELQQVCHGLLRKIDDDRSQGRQTRLTVDLRERLIDILRHSPEEN